MMSLLSRMVQDPAEAVLPEEEMERFADQLRGSAEATETFWSQYGLATAIIVGTLLAVGIMLLMIAGRYRRERAMMEAETQTDPLFGEAYAVGDDEDTLSHLAVFDDEVVIEDPAPMDEDRYDDEPVHSFNQADPAEDAQEDDDTPVMSFATSSFAAVDDEAEKIAPKIAPKDHAEPERDEATSRDPDVDDVPRYAFATGRASTTDTAPSFGDPSEAERSKDEPAPEPARFERAYTPPAARTPSDDEARPFVAPFIREDIEHAERRQAERIDSMREEFSRQFQMLKAEQSSRMDLVVSAIDRKLEALDQNRQKIVAASPDPSVEVNRSVSSLSEQVDRVTTAIEGQGQRIRTVTQILETRFAEVGHMHEEVKTVYNEVKSVRTDLGKATEAVSDVRGDLDSVREHVGRLERAILDRAAQDNATTVRLADVIRGTLPDGAYAFAATLANGETADCLINFDGLRQKIAVDAGFPMAAFHELPSRDAVRRNLPQAKGAEDAFRRAILRAILEAGDRCISPAETADSCLLFMPSEAAYTILHDRFPDLVRDSQRARVWLVSPSTLMGTLNLIRNLLPDSDDLSAREQQATEAAAKREDDDRLREEVAELRRRASGLADELDRTRGTLRDLIGAADPVQSKTREPQPERIIPVVEETTIDIDEDGMIDSLRFGGTPDWAAPITEERSSAPAASLYDDDRTDTLR